MYPRPSIAARVAARWVRRAFRDTSEDRVQEFIEAQGTKKVRRPSTGNDVQVSTLRSSDDPADQAMFRDLFRKWKDGADDTDDAGGGPREIKTQKDLKKVVDDFVEDAMGFGLTKAEALEYTKGLVVGDGEEAQKQVEKNLQRAIDKRIKENEAKAKDDADREKARAKEDADRAKAKADADREAEERRALRTDTEEALAGFRKELYDTALAGKMTPAEARRAIDPLVLGADRDVVESVKEAIDDAIAQKADAARSRDDARQDVESTAAAVEAAREALALARLGVEGNIADAEAELRDAESRHWAARVRSDDADLADLDDALADAELNAAQATADADAARAAVEDARSRIDQLDDPEKIAEAEAALSDAEDALQESDDAARAALSEVERMRSKRSEKLISVSRESFDRSWSRAQRNRGMVVYDASGKARVYNPEKTDAVYEYMMTLLGERIEERGGIDIDTTNRSVFDDPESKPKGKGKALTEAELRDRPTLSRRPRNDDGSSPTVDGWGNDRYGPHEFWNTGPNRWSAKNSQGDIATFTTMDRAKTFAKNGSMAVRIAARYVRGAS